MSKKHRSLPGAAAAGDLTAVKTLLARGAEIDGRNRVGHTTLIEAITNDRTAVALYLIGQKADPNLADRDGWTPLIWAAVRSGRVRHKNLALVEALLDAGADVNTPEPDGMTPLMFAANHGSVRLVEVLIARGADVNAKTTEEYNSGRTVLMFARPLAVVRVLLDAGADPKAVADNGETTWELQRGQIAKLLKTAAGVK